MDRYSLSVLSAIGRLWLLQEDASIVRLTGTEPADLSLYLSEKTPLLAEAERQLTEYFTGQRKAFDLPLAPVGTPFQRSVWQALREIPYGETRTYKEIAEAIGRPKAFRAVGQANNRNPLMIVQPCHRVVGADGSLTGFAYGTDMKRLLLDLEKTNR
ncbi:MAG: methylated-DNA--[Clostridia bacterium]|nr:methylated-DNA--[protein]-cysteine S-methyltransferase [Clostridia bacterium]